MGLWNELRLGARTWRRGASTVLHDALSFVGLGLVAGIPLALGASALVRSYLFGVGPRDVATLAAASIVVLAAAIAAASIPARRAPRVDPMLALRAE